MAPVNAESALSPTSERARATRIALALAVTSAVGLLWLANTPAGLLGKAEAIGYAVCHRIDLRSFHLGERALPLCARCTGMYLGAMLSIVGLPLAGRRRVGGFPARQVVPFLVLVLAAFGIDGVNSYLHFYSGAPHLYQPRNELRLITGIGLGLGMGAIVLAGFNQNSWKKWENRPILEGPLDILLLTLAGAGLVGLVLSENPLILYPLALISSLGVVVTLTSVYSVLVMLVMRLENRAESWMDLLLPVALGLGMAIVHLGSIDLVRYALFGTWNGFSL